MSNSPDLSAAELKVIDAGVLDYAAALWLQNELHAKVQADASQQFIVFVQHHSVLTLGKHADREHLLSSCEEFAAKGVQVLAIDRGGEVTAHMPGQLVVYPILLLSDFGLSPRSYVTLLEQVVIDTLADFDVKASRDAAYPGVWVGSEKICAVGIRIRQRVSMHGLALNVSNSLDLFTQIVPCGIRGRGVTSLSKATGQVMSVGDVQKALNAVLVARLQVLRRASRRGPPLQCREGVFTL